MGSNTLEFVYIGSLIFFVRALEFLEYNYVTKLLLTTYLIYGLYVVLRLFYDDLSILESYNYSRPLVLQINIITAFIYCTRYSVTPLLRCAYYSSIVYMGYILFVIYTYYTLAFFHFATFGLAAAYITTINLFYLEKLVKPRFHTLARILGYGGIVGVLLGMSRGGMLAVIIPFAMLFIFDKSKRTKGIGLTLVLGLLILASSYLLNTILPSNYIYQHQGATNLSELFQISQSLDTISTRLLRWNYLINGFLNNPFMGIGFYEETAIFALFRDAWMAHNYFLAILGGGGLLLFIPNVVLTAYPIKKFVDNLKVVKDKINAENLVGFIICLQVININFFNTYYYQMWSAVFIWCLMGMGLYLLTTASFYEDASFIDDRVGQTEYRESTLL